MKNIDLSNKIYNETINKEYDIFYNLEDVWRFMDIIARKIREKKLCYMKS